MNIASAETLVPMDEHLNTCIQRGQYYISGTIKEEM